MKADLHKSSKLPVLIASGMEFMEIFAGKPESADSIQQGGHVRNQKW